MRSQRGKNSMGNWAIGHVCDILAKNLVFNHALPMSQNLSEAEFKGNS